MDEALHCQEAIRRASEFLRGRIREDLCFLDCFTPDGTPSPVHRQGKVFAAFFIASAAADRLDAGEAELLRTRILSEARDGLWGYGPEAPLDSDDTAFALRALALVGAPQPTDPLMAFYRPSARLFLTFQSSARGWLEVVPSVANNMQVHADVAANIYSLLWDRQTLEYMNEELIRGAQAEDGYWRPYFYPSLYYAAHMFLELLRGTRALPGARQRGLEFVRESRNRDGTWGAPGCPYETALALNTLQTSGEREPGAGAAVRALLGSQARDGSWSTRKVIWRFRYSPTEDWLAYDSNRVVTTALAVQALRRHLNGAGHSQEGIS
jgi:hypothetical protein